MEKANGLLIRMLATAEYILEFLATFLFREMMKRNTIEPLRRIIKEQDPDMQLILLREWAQTKGKECSYIQVAVCNDSPSTYRAAYSSRLWRLVCNGLASTTATGRLQHCSTPASSLLSWRLS